MSEMIDRVARAICFIEYGSEDAGWDNQIPAARAAIEAMRDVDAGWPNILVAGKKALYSCSPDPELEDARGCWHAMIDEALK